MDADEWARAVVEFLERIKRRQGINTSALDEIDWLLAGASAVGVVEAVEVSDNVKPTPISDESKERIIWGPHEVGQPRQIRRRPFLYGRKGAT